MAAFLRNWGMQKMNYTYLLRCADGTLYCGWTNNLTRRLTAHNTGEGAKYTRTRHPVTLAYAEAFETKREAMQREAAIKKLSRLQKEALIASLAEEEWLTIYDETDAPCGALPRSLVHQLGLRHHVCHLWLCGSFASTKGVWLQQRAASRPLFPSLFDLAATGHIAHGETPLDAILREAQEEAGLVLERSAMTFIAAIPHPQQTPLSFDDEIAYSYLVEIDGLPPFEVGDEVAQMVFVPLDAFDAAHHTDAPLTAYFTDGIPFSLTHESVCCLHQFEWDSVRQVLSI